MTHNQKIIIGLTAFILVTIMVLIVFLFQSRPSSDIYKELIQSKQEVIESLKRERLVYEELRNSKDSLINLYLDQADKYDAIYRANQINHSNNQRRYNEIPQNIKRLGRNTDSIRSAFSDF